MTTSFLPSPTLLASLTALGQLASSVPSLSVLADGGVGLELDTCVPLELARAREHAASMLPRVATEAARARMVESLSLPADDARGLLYALSCGCTEGAPGEAASLRMHQDLLAKLEATKGEYGARAEMEAYTAELKVAIKADIARLVAAVGNLESNEAALETARQQPAYRAEAAQWESVHSLWQAVQQAMAAAEGLSTVAPADAQRVQAASRLTAAIHAATVKLEAPVDLAVPASSEAVAFDVQLLASMATLLQHQLQSLADWSGRNTDLGASIAAAQKMAPRIASFAAAQAEAQAAGAAVSDLDRPLKSVRTASSILSKLSGLALLQQMEVEHTDEASGGMPCMATQMLVAVRGQPGAGAVASSMSDEEMYASEASFARVLAAQQAAEPDHIVLQVLLLTPAQCAEVEALRAGPATVASIVPASPASSADHLSSSRVLRVDVLGSLRACQLPGLIEAATGQGQRSPEEVQRALETTLIPCPESSAAGVARATRRAIEEQRKYGRGALDSLMRDIAFGQ